MVEALKSNSALKKLKLDGTQTNNSFVHHPFLIITLAFFFRYSGNNISTNILTKIKKEIKKNKNPMLIKEKERITKLKNMSLV